MNRREIFVFVIVIVAALLLTSPARAADDWNWSITPYIWASNISEDLLILGEIEGGGDTEFKDLLDIADTSLQLHFEGTRDRWGLFADLTYVELSDSETGDLELLRFDVEIQETLFEAGAIFRPGGRSGNFDLLFGARLMSLDEKYRLQLGERDPRERSIDEAFLDALIGARYRIPLSERWMISLRGDLSLGGTDFIWTAQGLLGWRFGAKRNSAVFVGYQYRDMKYNKGENIEVERTFSGPALGVKIGF
jgi:hypothetical protein